MSWTEVRLADVMKQVSEREHLDRNKTYVTCGVRGKARGLFTRESQLGREIKAQYLYRLRAGEFVYNRLFAGEGAFAIVPPEAHGLYVSNEFPTFHVDGSVILPEFLALWFSRPQIWSMVADASTGSTQSRSRWKEAQLLATQVVVPSIDQQRRIVDLLSSADASVESLEVELEAAKNVRRQLLIDAIRGHFASPASKAVKFGDVAESRLGKMLNTSRQTGEGARPYLRAANITAWGKLDLSDLKSMDFDEAELDKFSVKTGDLLVTEGGDAGRCVVYAGEKVLCFQNAVHRVRADRTKTSNEYLALMLEYLSATGQLDRYCSTTTIKHLSSGSLKNIELRLPTLAVQQSAVANTKAATALAEAVALRLQQAKYLCDQLLHDLLSGAHTITESYDRFLTEAAS